MKFACMSTLIFFIALNTFAETKQNQLDFHSYVRENYQILTHVKKPEKERKAFQPVEQRDPATEPSLGYENDKNGHVAASSGSIWGSMSGNQNQPPNQNQQQPQQQVPQQQAQPSQSPASGSSSSSGGESLPQ